MFASSRPVARILHPIPSQRRIINRDNEAQPPVKHSTPTFLAIATLAAISFSVAPSPKREAAANDQSSRSPVVVELFTSEGCSSCPPADALLASLEDQQ